MRGPQTKVLHEVDGELGMVRGIPKPHTKRGETADRTIRAFIPRHLIRDGLRETHPRQLILLDLVRGMTAAGTLQIPREPKGDSIPIGLQLHLRILLIGWESGRNRRHLVSRVGPTHHLLDVEVSMNRTLSPCHPDLCRHISVPLEKCLARQLNETTIRFHVRPQRDLAMRYQAIAHTAPRAGNDRLPSCLIQIGHLPETPPKHVSLLRPDLHPGDRRTIAPSRTAIQFDPTITELIQARVIRAYLLLLRTRQRRRSLRMPRLWHQSFRGTGKALKSGGDRARISTVPQRYYQLPALVGHRRPHCPNRRPSLSLHMPMDSRNPPPSPPLHLAMLRPCITELVSPSPRSVLSVRGRSASAFRKANKSQAGSPLRPIKTHLADRSRTSSSKVTPSLHQVGKLKAPDRSRKPSRMSSRGMTMVAQILARILRPRIMSMNTVHRLKVGYSAIRPDGTP